MVAVQELEEIIPVLYDLERVEKFNMSNWVEGVLNPNSDKVTECGTQFCMAGAKAYHDGWLPQWTLEYRTIPIPNTPGQTRVVEMKVATGEFLPADCEHLLGQEDVEEERNAESIAYEAFDLDDDYGHLLFLFHGTHITRVADLERRIRWVIDNPTTNTYDFPREFIQEEREHGCQDARGRSPFGHDPCTHCPEEYRNRWNDHHNHY